jgi:hypothetical protein
VKAQPGVLDRVEYFLRIRVRALLEARRNDEALAAAKSLYNVASLAGTPGAIDLVARSLATARPQEPGVGRRFKLEQLAAASPSAELDVSSEPGGSVLKMISVDPTVYDAAPVDAERNREWRALAKGNLALLCDRPDDAMAHFTPLLRSSNPDVRRAATGAIARATKAKAGGVHAANEYLTSAMTRGVSGGAP